MELTFLDFRFDEPWARMPKGEEQDRAKKDARIVDRTAASATSPTRRRFGSGRAS
jgi:hypothetical protein